MNEEIQQIKKDTLNALGNLDLDLSYIDENLLEQNRLAKAANLKSGDALGQQDGNKWGVYCYNVNEQGDKYFFTSYEPKSAPGYYVCQTPGQRFYVPKKEVKEYEHVVHTCPSNASSLWFLGNYKGGAGQFGRSEQ